MKELTNFGVYMASLRETFEFTNKDLLSRELTPPDVFELSRLSRDESESGRIQLPHAYGLIGRTARSAAQEKEIAQTIAGTLSVAFHIDRKWALKQVLAAYYGRRLAEICGRSLQDMSRDIKERRPLGEILGV